MSGLPSGGNGNGNGGQQQSQQYPSQSQPHHQSNPSSLPHGATHAPAPSLALSAHQAHVITAQAQAQQQGDISDKLKTLKLEQQGSQASSAAAAGGSGGSAAAAAAPSSAHTPTHRKKEMGAVRYAAERVIGNGSFGVVYQATVIETGETVAIKKVLQDPKFKNRELQIMGMMDHPDVISLKHCFYSKGEKPDEVYLNLVMDYIPETIHRTLRTYTKANKLLPIMYTKVYMYQISRSLAYIHSLGVCHRDIKPQNLLLDTKTHHVLLCDFGSAKILVPGEPNVSYICSRYYRAPELVFEATQYTTAIDVWSLGCVMAEMLLGNPLFPGESAVDQLIEIIKILGTPTREEIHAMNPNHTCLLVGSEVRMADGSCCAVEKLSKNSVLLSSTGGSTRITYLAPGTNAKMFAIEYACRGRGSPLKHVVTADHLVTLRCPKGPAIHVAHTDGGDEERAELCIDWLDGKTLKPGNMKFRLSSMPANDDPDHPHQEHRVSPILPIDVSARAHTFARWWLQHQSEKGVIKPLYKGDLFDVPAQTLHAFMQAQDHTPYIQEIIAGLGIPMCWAKESSTDVEMSNDDVGSSSSSPSRPSSPSAAARSTHVLSGSQIESKSKNDAKMADNADASFNELIEAFRAAHGMAVESDAAPSNDSPNMRQRPPVTMAGGEVVGVHMQLMRFQEVVDAAKKIGDDVEVLEEFSQMVSETAGAFRYHSPMTCDHSVDIVYMLHHPVAPKFGVGANGKKAYAFQQMEDAWRGMMECGQTNLFTGVMVTHLNPIIARSHRELDSMDEAYEEVCFKSIESVLQTRPRVVVAFGLHARQRWMQFVKVSQSVAKYEMETPHNDDDSGSDVPRMHVELIDGLAIDVVFAPHPTCSWLNDEMSLAIAAAHGLNVHEDAELAASISYKLSTHATLMNVRPMENGDYVSFAVDAPDARFVLKDGAITHNSFKFPQIKPHPWAKVFRNKAPANAIDLVSKWLRYEPKSRLDPFEALAHPFFDDLREPGAKMPNQQYVPEKLFQFTENELKVMQAKGLTKKIIPAHLQKNYNGIKF